MPHRAEVKVYMSHTDYYRIQKLAEAQSMSVSTLLRSLALAAADAVSIPKYSSLFDDRQLELPRLGSADAAFCRRLREEKAEGR